jgi:hypothetical protein
MAPERVRVRARRVKRKERREFMMRSPIQYRNIYQI